MEVLISPLIPDPSKPGGHASDLAEVTVDSHSLQIKYAMCSWLQPRFYELTKLPVLGSFS